MAPRQQQQQPAGQFTDLFKKAGVDGWPRGDYERAGDASVAVDRVIGRPVVRLAGAVPAANSLRMPWRREGRAGLGSSHRFLYLQLRLEPGKTYALHAEYATADRSQHRLSVSNLFGGQDAARARRAGGLQIFLPAAHDAWTLLAIDMHGVAAAAAGGGGRADAPGTGGSPFSRLCSLHLCANMTVRGAFTSDVVYDWRSLPTDLAFSAAFDLDQARVLWLPGEPTGAQVAMPRPCPTSPRSALPPRPPAAPPGRRQPRAPSEDAALLEQDQQLVMQPSPMAQLERLASFSGQHLGLLHWVPGVTSNGSQEIVFAAGSVIVAMQPLSSTGGRELRQQQRQQRQPQRLLHGHAGAVRALALSACGRWLASAEAGCGAALRLWDLRQGVCIATVPGHAGGTTCLDVSPDGSMLASAGVDAQGRQELACWDVSACWGRSAGSDSGSGGGGACRAREQARQASEYNIQVVRFLPHEPGRLATCGKNSIRVHRLKDGQLRSLSVTMEGVAAARRPYSCGTLASADSATVGEVFTCLAFEQPLWERPLGPRRLYAGTASGAVYTVDLESRAVEGVTQVHSAAVAALAVHDGFCVTGSADRRLRLWGSDLREAYMEAAHEGAVTGIGLSPDGLWVAVGTDSGALSLLDVSSSKYTTLLRSHTAGVHAVALLGRAPQPAGQDVQQPGQSQREKQQQYCTASADGTVRVWSGADHQQVLELCAPGETVLSVACHPYKEEVACGSRGGALRIFDAASAALLQESRQHTGTVKQLAFARHGRVLLSLGEDGCVCAYDACRSYMPTTFVLAGFPLHATAMAVSTDGKLLATAALSPRPGSSGGAAACRPSSPAGRGKGSACLAQPVIVVHNTVSMQPVLQLPVAGSSRVTQLQLLPDGQHVLALTEDGRLLGYSCTDGTKVVDVPRALASPCLAAALDPSGTYLVAGTAAGLLKVWGLHSLHRLPRAEEGRAEQPEQAHQGCAALIRSLPSQEVCGPAGSAVLGLAFLGSRQLLAVGSAGEVCCWSFFGETCHTGADSEDADAATAQRTLVVAPQQQQRPSVAAAGAAAACKQLHQHQTAAAAATSAAATVSLQAPLRPVVNLSADCTGQMRSAPAATAPQQDGQEQQLTREQAPATAPSSQGADSPAPRSMPAPLQHLPLRPPSVPSMHHRTAADGASTVGGQKQSASLLASSHRGQNRAPPIWERYPPPPEASLLVTATPGKRCTQVVRERRQLRITSPAKCGSSRGGGGAKHSVEWVQVEADGDRVPAYWPDQQLQLLPPAASVRRVCGFDSAAGFQWLPPAGPASAQQQQQLLYASGNVLLLEDLPSAHQRHLARLPRDITALAASTNGRLVAAAARPAAAGGSTADVHLVRLQGGCAAQELSVLSHHSFAVQAMAFNPDGSLLATVSTSPDGTTSSLALWSVEEPAELVAGVQLAEAVVGLAWELPAAATQLPAFYTAGSKGLVQWQLEPEALTSTAVHMPAALSGGALTAVATCLAEEGRQDGGKGSMRGMKAGAGMGSKGSTSISTVYVGDGSGRVWRLEVDCGQDVPRAQLLAEVRGQAVSCLAAAGPHLLGVGTGAGSLLLLTEAEEESVPGQQVGWRMLSGEQLDGAVLSLQLDAGSREATATTACGTLWQVPSGGGHASSPAPAQVLLCGQQQGLRGWHLVQGAGWKGVPPSMAVASAAGVGVWQMGESGSSAIGRAPLVEFSLLADATLVSLAEDASVCAAAYADGSICLYDVVDARLRWKAAGAAEQGGMVALAVVQRLRGCKVMVVYRSGALFVLDGSSGQVAHRTLQFAVRQESGRQCPSNFQLAGLALHPADSAVFALCGQQALTVCKAAWTKNAAVTPLARLSFGPADASDSSTCSSNSGAAGNWQEVHRVQDAAAPAVHAVLSRSHPGHLYCSNPAAPGQLLLFDYTSQAVVKTLLAPLEGAPGGGSITALALHPSETLLAAGTSNGSVLLLRLETESWAELAAHAEGAPVVGLTFGACGTRLFSAAAGACTTLVWELEQ